MRRIQLRNKLREDHALPPNGTTALREELAALCAAYKKPVKNYPMGATSEQTEAGVALAAYEAGKRNFPLPQLRSLQKQSLLKAVLAVTTHEEFLALLTKAAMGTETWRQWSVDHLGLQAQYAKFGFVHLQTRSIEAGKPTFSLGGKIYQLEKD